MERVAVACKFTGGAAYNERLLHGGAEPETARSHKPVC